MSAREFTRDDDCRILLVLLDPHLSAEESSSLNGSIYDEASASSVPSRSLRHLAWHFYEHSLLHSGAPVWKLLSLRPDELTFAILTSTVRSRNPVPATCDHLIHIVILLMPILSASPELFKIIVTASPRFRPCLRVGSSYASFSSFLDYPT